jgi:predicted glycoside hydrolase/deacetylase ChbG (UPF0249 family)
MKILIVNADDFGYTHGIDEAIIEAHVKGVVTSTSLMVYGKDAINGSEIAKKYPHLGIGLHFQIPESDRKIITGNKGSALQLEAIKKSKSEFIRQINLFTKFVGKKPDHIDSHHHVHQLPRLNKFISIYSKQNNIPLRDNGTNFINIFYGAQDLDNISVHRLIEIIKNLPEGISELMCHPGIVDRELAEISNYVIPRKLELETLMNLRVRKTIDKLNIRLANWNEIFSIIDQ